jgi:hypothetical protein
MRDPFYTNMCAVSISHYGKGQKMGTNVARYEETKLGRIVKDDLLARGKKNNTANNWSLCIDRFVSVCGEKDVYERMDIVEFIGSLREAGLRQTSITVMLRPVKLLSQIQGWNMPKLSMPKVRESDIKRPVVPAVDINNMIKRAKDCCNPDEIAFLCLSSVYGVRREEITEVEIGEKLKVSTLKGGRVVEHIIPNELRPYLKGFSRKNITYMSRCFRRICKKCGNGHGMGEGWHSIRRSLATELVMSGVSVFNIVRFMRWSETSMRGEFGMLGIYAKKDQERVDLEVFKVHPFVSAWIGESEGMIPQVRLAMESGSIRFLLNKLADELEKSLSTVSP